MEKPTQAESAAFHEKLFGDVRKHGWRVRLNARFGFHPPDFWYELVVNRLIGTETRWVDIGGGKAIFPNNPKLSQELSQRCRFLLGVDPSEHVLQNPFVHRGLVGTTESIPREEAPFDVATMRMVAEHIEQPAALIESLRNILGENGLIVLLTPNRRSPNAVLASIIPNALHPWIVSKIFGRMPEDVFQRSSA